MKKFVLLILFGTLGSGISLLTGAPLPDSEEEVSSALLRDETDSDSEFMIRIWKAGDGLPANEVHDLQETPDGYLWLGTPHGLARFDGVRFESFFTTPTGARYGTSIRSLEIDSRGQLWFAADQVGIIRHNADGFTEFLTNGTVLKDRPVSLSRDGANGLLWVDARGGLGRISTEEPNDAESLEVEGASSGSRWVRDFKDRLWLTDQRTLKIFEKGKWRNVPVPGSATMVAAPRRAGGMWIAREAKLRYVTADGNTREIASVPWVGQSRVTCLFEDSGQRLWVGTLGQGLFCYISGEFKRVVPTASSILTLFEDGQKNIWAGTRGSGLVRVRHRQFFMYNLSSGLKNEFVRSVAQGKSGRVWMTTADGGLGWFENGSWRELGREDGWRNFDSLSVLPRADGSVWISTIHRGLWHWSDGKFTRHIYKTNPPREPAVDLLEDQEGRLWMVTDNNGVYCLEGDRLTRYSTNAGMPSRHIRRMVEDESGGLWAGDWEGGIAKFTSNRWEVVRKSSGHSDAVRSMVASEGALWIGTSSGGLLRFKNSQTSRVSAEQGLPDDCVQQLLLDGKGSLWGGTPHKLFRLSLQQLNAVMDGRERKIDAVIYGRGDGLPDVSFGSWCDPRSWRTTDGELWFATANGAIHFQPDNLQKIEMPQVLIEQTLLDGKPITASALKQLRPGPGRIEFRFTAPCLTAPERVLFRYQLTGVDSDWVDARTARTATYGSIPAGDHVFRVIASSPEGVWNSQAATVALAVHPFFWQTTWFLAAIAAAIAGGGVWAARWATVRRLNLRLERMQQQRAMDQERARIAQDIHDELGANLTSIGLLADLGERHKFDSSMVGRELKQISQTARESVAAMDAIVWALNPRNDSLDNFANYVAQFTREFFRPTQLRTRLELPADLPAHRLATETRHQLFLLVKESFNNVVRHSQATEVTLELACQNGDLRLIISDNGKGLSGKTVGEGQNGLDNLRSRIERLGGKLNIQSKNGHGARLEFVLPIKQSSPGGRLIHDGCRSPGLDSTKTTDDE